MIKKIKKYLYDNEKRDVYQIQVKAIKKGVLKFDFFTRINVTKSFYPTRRLVAKLYGKNIEEQIKLNKINKNCKIEVIVLSKIGTFKRKNIK